MKETTNFKLKMPEVGDPVAVAPFNENAQIIDAALKGKIMMESGSYTGDGTLTRTISTPGFKPQVVLMRTPGSHIGESIDGGVNNNLVSGTHIDCIQVNGGWCLWTGESTLPGKYLLVFRDTIDQMSDKVGYTVECAVTFEAKLGSLTWSIPPGPDKHPGYPDYYAEDKDNSGIVNNTKGQKYQWIAFGVAV